MKSLFGRCVGAIVLGTVVLSVSVLVARPMKAADTSTVEGLLKKAGLDYAKTAGGAFKVIYEYKDETSVLYVDELSLSDDEKRDDAKVMRVSTLVLDAPDNFKHPTAMLKKIAVLHETLIIGKLSVDEKLGDVYYQSSFWLRKADEDVVNNEMSLAHFNRIEFKKELKPFITE
jgi:hypothetical protein